MSSILNYEQDLKESKNKEKYGEVNTDFKLITKMLSIIPIKCFTNPKLKWLDPCCGHGYFMIILFKKLYTGLNSEIPNDEQRTKHIIENMLYMVELDATNVAISRSIFCERDDGVVIHGNISEQDFLAKA